MQCWCFAGTAIFKLINVFWIYKRTEYALQKSKRGRTACLNVRARTIRYSHRADKENQPQRNKPAGQGHTGIRFAGSLQQREVENGFELGIGMRMPGLERMRVHNNNAIHHVGVGEQRNAAPVGCEYKQQGHACESVFPCQQSAHSEVITNTLNNESQPHYGYGLQS